MSDTGRKARVMFICRAPRGETASRSALKRVVSTFFQGSVTQTMAALLETARYPACRCGIEQTATDHQTSKKGGPLI